jgi:hypothetical protein
MSALKIHQIHRFTYEASVLVSVTVEIAKRLLTVEVLELNNHAGENLAGSLHELIHESLLLRV